MGLKDLPLATGARHVAAFERAGWYCTRIKGSHHILERQGVENLLSIPCHAGRDVKRGLLAGLIAAAGMTQDEYCDYFYKRKRR